MFFKSPAREIFDTEGGGRAFTHHDERPLHAKDGVAREEDVAFWVQRRRQLVETGGVDHDVQVARANVVASECQKQLTHRALCVNIFADKREDRKTGGHEQKGVKVKKRWGRQTSPGMGYAMGTTARYPKWPSASVRSLPRQSGTERSAY